MEASKWVLVVLMNTQVNNSVTLSGMKDYILQVSGERLGERKEEQIYGFGKSSVWFRNRQYGRDLEESRNFI